MIKIHDNSDGTMPHPLTSRYDGLLAIAPMIDVDTLLMGYRFGIFPWESQGQIGFYYFPKKRYVIKPSEIKIAKSMRSYFNQRKFEISIDENFEAVIRSCRIAKRNSQNSTWISNQFEHMYGQLHDLGYAHSLEVWQDDVLVGGLYGVAIGKIFTGESMFSHVSNASKFAMIYLAKYLEKKGFIYIDCQVYNEYLASFGGEEIDNEVFYNIMKNNLTNIDDMEPWEYVEYGNGF